MNSTGLYDTFRSDVVDTARPYLWTDDDVWRYAADAHRMFIRPVAFPISCRKPAKSRSWQARL